MLMGDGKNAVHIEWTTLKTASAAFEH
jgi:hypothetical protein